MTFLDHFLNLKLLSNTNCVLAYVNTDFYNYKYDVRKDILFGNKAQENMFNGIIFHPVNVWHLQFTLGNQTRGFDLLTNLTSQPSKRYNTYCTYNNCFVDNPMLIFEKNRILDFLEPRKNPFVANNTLVNSLKEYQGELYSRLLEPNRRYLHLENCDNALFKHKLLYIRG